MPSRRGSDRRPVRRPSAVFQAAATLVLIGLLSSCSDQSEGRASEQTRQPAVPVSVAPVQVRDVPVELSTFGQVESCQTIEVKAQVGGMVTEAHFSEGGLVHANDLLFDIDARPFRAALEQADATLAQAQARARNAQVEFDRIASLHQRNQSTELEYEQAKAALDAAKAEVQADIAARHSAALQADYCTIRSPISGIAGDLLIDPGNTVKAYDLPLVRIRQIQPIYVSFALPQEHLPQVRLRQTAEQPLVVRASVPGDQDSSSPGEGPAEIGRLSFIDNTVDTSAGTIRMKGTFANGDAHLWPGQFVNVVLELAMRRNVPVVPSRAVQAGQQGQYVFVVQADRTVRMQPVTVEFARDDQTVIASGLQGGDVVVTDGFLRLAPGMAVEVRPEVQPLSANLAPSTQPASGDGPGDSGGAKGRQP